MKVEEIRAKIRERLKAGTFPRNLPRMARIESGADVQPFLKIGQTAHPCSACDMDGPTMTYVYGDREVRFHEEYEKMWEEESAKLDTDLGHQ